MDLESEVKELREELQEKEEIIDERCAKIEELTLQVHWMRFIYNSIQSIDYSMLIKNQINFEFIDSNFLQ